MKPLITLILLFLSCLTFGQKDKDFLLSYTDSSSEEGLIGYKTTGGRIIIKAKYSFAYTDTFYKMAIVSKDYHWIGINRNEKVILKPFIFDNCPDYVEEGLFRFVENNKIGFANLDGEKIISAKFDFAEPFQDGLSAYTLGGHRQNEKDDEHWYWVGGYENGYINKSGQYFKKVKKLEHNNREAWTKNNRHVLLDKDGKIIKWFNK